jgi:hypothetical protein
MLLSSKTDHLKVENLAQDWLGNARRNLTKTNHFDSSSQKKKGKGGKSSAKSPLPPENVSDLVSVL